MRPYLRSLRSAELYLLGLGLVLGAMTFLYLPPAEGFQDPDAARAIVFHLPMAWLCTVWFIVSAVFAVRYLKSRRLEEDLASAAAAGIGLLCCVLATVTGSIFAHTQWGSWWNWDPRETSIFFLLLIYGAYFALRGSLEEPVQRSLFSAVYALLACMVMPFLVFILPRMYESLHPSRVHLAASYWTVLLISLTGFGSFFTWVFRIRCAIDRDELELQLLQSAELRNVIVPTANRTPSALHGLETSSGGLSVG